MTSVESFTLSNSSMLKLETCDSRLQRVILAAIENAPFQFVVTCGHRAEADQNEAVKKLTSKLVWPKSKHNASPSLAVDLAPLIDGRIPWVDLETFHRLAEHIKSVAESLNIPINAGADFRNFRDLPHFELTDQWPPKFREAEDITAMEVS